MPSTDRRRPILRTVPLGLAVGLLALVVLAGLMPNTGVVSASSNCSYGQCPSSSSFPVWEVSAAAILAVLALIVGLLLLRRRRRQPPQGDAGPGAAAGTGAGGAAGWSEEGTAPEQDWSEPSGSTEGYESPAGEEAPADDGTGGPSA